MWCAVVLLLVSFVWLWSNITGLFPDAFPLGADAWAELAFGLAGIPAIAAFLICIIATCMMTFRLTKNLHTVAPADMRTSPTMSVAWYFIPVANLLMPARTVGEIWRTTFTNIEVYGKDSGIVGLWWFSWIVSGFASRIELRLLEESGYYGDTATLNTQLFTSGLWVGVVAAVAHIIACLLYLSVFGQIMRAQKELVRRHAA